MHPRGRLPRRIYYRGQRSSHIRKAHEDGPRQTSGIGIPSESKGVFSPIISSDSTPRFHNKLQDLNSVGSQSQSVNDLCREASCLLHHHNCSIPTQIMCDNTSAIAYVNKFEGTRSPALLDLSRCIWNFCLKTNTRILLPVCNLAI